jgi:hypothetical protein
MRIRRAIVPLMTAAGLAWVAVAVLDPVRSSGRLGGPLLVLAALGLARTMKLRAAPFAVASVLACAWSVSAGTLIEFRGDSSWYFAYLRSASFDRDLDFRNEMEELRGGAGRRRRISTFSAGPAVLWSPFYLAAHLYVGLDRAYGRGLYEADGFSLPYRRATALGTVAVVVLGYSLLFLAIAAMRGRAVAALAVGGAVLASPVLYYTIHVPATSHGVASGLAAAFVWAWERARREPSFYRWTLLGGTFGFLVVCRWQAAVYGVLAGFLAIEGLLRRRVRFVWLAAAAAATAIAFAPQILAWNAIFGRSLLLPQGRGYLDLASPRWLDTLLSADHGFFNWTPLMLAGFLGLLAGLRASPLLHGGALLVFALTTWVNGSVAEWDWAAGDSFGARRFSEVVPLMALGLAYLLESSKRVLTRWPLVAPAAAIAGLVLWNLGFVWHFRARKYPDAAPLERLAKDQARLLQDSASDAAGKAFGARGRALGYKIFSGEYFYAGLDPSGTILLRSDERFLREGWSTGSRRTARRTYRRALHPEACVAVPLDAIFPLRISVTARAPDGLEDQTLTLAVNEQVIGSAPLGTDWSELPFLVPGKSLIRGENALCLRFSRGLGEPPVGALVERIQLP